MKEKFNVNISFDEIKLVQKIKCISLLLSCLSTYYKALEDVIIKRYR